jgi:prolyl 4-hydroxylase
MNNQFNYNILNDFISNDVCNIIKKYFSDKLSPSGVLGDSSIRTSDDFYIQENLIDDESVLENIKLIKSKISEISQLPIENQELLTIIRYKPGQEFKTHLDAFQSNEMIVQSILGGQRCQTFILCIQSADEGGETFFPELDKQIKLESGQCIHWKNIDENGMVFNESLHSGKTPVSGEKWILTCWIRENEYYPINHHLIENLLETYDRENIIEIIKSINKQSYL